MRHFRLVATMQEVGTALLTDGVLLLALVS